MNTEKRTALLEALLERLLASVAAADSKIAPAFAIDTAMLGVLAVLVPRYGSWDWYSALCAGLAATLLAGSVLMLSLASFPRTDGPRASLLFFGAICRRPLGKFVEEIETVTLDEYRKDLAEQCHRNAEIASKKFFWIRWAMRALYLGLALWIPSLFFLYRSRT